MDREEIRNQVRMVLPPEVSDVTDDYLNTMMNQSLLEVGTAFRWPFLEDSELITTVADQQAYALPADFLHAEAVVNNDTDCKVEYLASSRLFKMYGSSSTASSTQEARYWSLWNNELLFYPIPDDAYSDRYTLYYYRTIEQLNGDSDEPEFNPAFHYMLVEWLKWRLYEREAMVEEAQASRQMFQNYLYDMQRWYNNVVKPEPYTFGDGIRRGRFGDPNLPQLNYLQ